MRALAAVVVLSLASPATAAPLLLPQIVMRPEPGQATTQPVFGNVTVRSRLRLLDNAELRFGNDIDYWWVYSSASTELRLRSTNCDGVGTDCTVLRIDDGTDDVEVSNGDFLLVGDNQIRNTSQVLELGAGGATGHSLTSTDTYVTGALEVDGALWADGALTVAGTTSHSGLTVLGDGQNVLFGTSGSNDSVILPSSSFGQLSLGLRSGTSAHGRALTIVDRAQVATDYAHGDQTNPTVFIHSATAAATSTAQWVGFAHSTTAAQITTGLGHVDIDPVAGSGLQVNSTTAILGHLSATASLDYNLSAAGITCQDLTITVTGAAAGDSCGVGAPASGLGAGVHLHCWVSAANTCTIRACDVTSSGANPAAETYRCDTWQH